MILTGKEKAVVGSIIALIVGLANVLLPFIADPTVLHYITIGLAVVGFLGVYFGVYKTTNTTPGEHVATDALVSGPTSTTTTPDVTGLTPPADL